MAIKGLTYGCIYGQLKLSLACTTTTATVLCVNEVRALSVCISPLALIGCHSTAALDEGSLVTSPRPAACYAAVRAPGVQVTDSQCLAPSVSVVFRPLLPVQPYNVTSVLGKLDGPHFLFLIFVAFFSCGLLWCSLYNDPSL